MNALTKETGLADRDVSLSSEEVPSIDGKKPEARFVRVTPEIARAWLSQNHDQQRNIRENRIERYASQMSKGLWKISSDGIAFDTNGKLINGQHRLQSVVESDEPEWMLVVWNLDPETKKYIDEGIKRTPSDTLTVHGFEDPMHVAAAVRLVIFWRQGNLRHCAEYNAIQNYEIVQAAETCSPRIYESVDFAAQFKTEEIKPPRSLITFAHFLYEPTYGRKAVDALEKICTGDRIDPSQWGSGTSPAKLVRKEFIEEFKNDDKEVARHEKVAYLIKGMNWQCNDEEKSRLRYRETDKFPAPRIDPLPEFAPALGGEDGEPEEKETLEPEPELQSA